MLRIEEFRNRYMNQLEYRIMMKHKWHAEQQLMEKLDNLSLSHNNGESSMVHYIEKAPDSARRARLIEVKLRQPVEAQNEPQRAQPDPEGLDQEIDS
ncbi:uncharacterized protein LOC121787696 isoform X2 [Salvia splendens]|uniref:uncharacterized protein LOC121787696 isoform X2 n=1 Tax=Salvia splendens TaxID=180675 RepID=UPI001C27EC75|nr:uncharacterized protein LOC121787696 isoform X2 [Salvia splendens]